MRVVAGALARRSVSVPRGARPTSGRLREALFSILGEIRGARCLDLFAGSGALGIEALSRGAESALFVDSDPAAARAIGRNLEELGLRRVSRVIRGTLPAALAAAREWAPFDLVLADPPYRWTAWERLLEEAGELLGPGGALVVEHAAAIHLPAPELFGGAGDRRVYGESALTLWYR